MKTKEVDVGMKSIEMKEKQKSEKQWKNMQCFEWITTNSRNVWQFCIPLRFPNVFLQCIKVSAASNSICGCLILKGGFGWKVMMREWRDGWQSEQGEMIEWCWMMLGNRINNAYWYQEWMYRLACGRVNAILNFLVHETTWFVHNNGRRLTSNEW